MIKLDSELMQFSKFLIKDNPAISILDAIKIVILVTVSFILLLNFYPYFFGADSLIYGMTAVSFSNGEYGITNELMKEFAGPPFIPHQWVPTIHDSAIPRGNPGIIGLAGISYILGGYYGLFFLGPIFTILLLIFSERISTKLFGNLAGLVALVLVASDWMIFRNGQQLLTDNIFTVFFIIGSFYLIKFVQERRESLIFLSSIFFVLATFVRLNGTIFFLVEISIVAGYFVYQNITQLKKNPNAKRFSLNHLRFSDMPKQLFKSIIFLAAPWLVFFIFFLSFNAYYFGDPLTNYKQEALTLAGSEEDIGSRFFQFDFERFEWMKFYSVGLIPDILQSSILQLSKTEINHFLDKNWLSIFSLGIIGSAFLISLYYKKNRTEVITLISLIVGTLFFYSATSLSWGPIQDADPSSDLQERYMIHGSVMSLMLLSFIISQGWKIKTRYISIHSKKLSSRIFYLVFLIFLASFLIASFYYSPSVQLPKSGSTIYDPTSLAERYPLDKEGLSENSIIMFQGRSVVEYDAIPFETNTGFSKHTGFNPELINQEHIQILKKILEEGYEVYSFKSHLDGVPQFLRYLETEYGMILKVHSKTFCKLELLENLDETHEDNEIESDNICYFRKGIIYT